MLFLYIFLVGINWLKHKKQTSNIKNSIIQTMENASKQSQKYILVQDALAQTDLLIKLQRLNIFITICLSLEHNFSACKNKMIWMNLLKRSIQILSKSESFLFPASVPPLDRWKRFFPLKQTPSEHEERHPMITLKWEIISSSKSAFSAILAWNIKCNIGVL